MPFWKKRKPPSEPVPPPEPSLEEEGILAIRPKPRGASSRPATLSEPRVQPPDRARKREFLHPYLKAIRMALHADTVSFLRPLPEQDAYYVDEISGVRTHLDLPESFTLPPSFPTEDTPLQLLCMEDFREGTWQYCRPGEQTCQLLAARVPLQGPPGFLLVDRRQAEPPFSALEQSLILDFARLLSRVLLEGESPTRHLRPRREILAEIMDQARASDQPVTFILVAHRQAEQAVDTPDPAREASLRKALETLAPEQRVEPFGPLMFGLFYFAPRETVSHWMLRLNDRLLEDFPDLAPGVYLGAVELAETHTSPEMWREDARLALQQAYENDEPVYIVAE